MGNSSLIAIALFQPYPAYKQMVAVQRISDKQKCNLTSELGCCSSGQSGRSRVPKDLIRLVHHARSVLCNLQALNKMCSCDRQKMKQPISWSGRLHLKTGVCPRWIDQNWCQRLHCSESSSLRFDARRLSDSLQRRLTAETNEREMLKRA